ncbi:MAG: hypothetical protein GF401_02560 [Chitinivibrionales bacterium]|nr:hypothetical protein [Chitinivibrionales bacterium]
MRVALFMVLAVLSAEIYSLEMEKYAVPKENDIGVFAHEIRKPFERSLFSIGKDDRLLIVEEGRNHLKVIDPEKRVGWVEKGLVSTMSGRKQFEFANETIIGYDAHVHPYIIMGVDQQQGEMIPLDRSFGDALRENADKETIDRLSVR